MTWCGTRRIRRLRAASVSVAGYLARFCNSCLCTPVFNVFCNPATVPIISVFPSEVWVINAFDCTWCGTRRIRHSGTRKIGQGSRWLGGTASRVGWIRPGIRFGEVALEGGDEIALGRVVDDGVFLAVVVVRRDVVLGAIAQIEEQPTEVVGQSLAFPLHVGISLRVVDVQELVAAAANGAVPVDLEEQAALVLPPGFSVSVSDDVPPGFTVHLVGGLDSGIVHNRSGDVHGRDGSVQGASGGDLIGVVHELRDADPVLVQGPLGVHSVVFLEDEDGVFVHTPVLEGVHERPHGIVDPDLTEGILVAVSPGNDGVAVGLAALVL